MPAKTSPIHVDAGSYEPRYWTITDPGTGEPLDLTASGYSVSGVVVDSGPGVQVLAELADGEVWRRTAQGRIYFEPPSEVSAAWTFTNGQYQAELTHPSGESIRFAQGQFVVSPDFSFSTP